MDINVARLTLRLKLVPFETYVRFCQTSLSSSSERTAAQQKQPAFGKLQLKSRARTIYNDIAE